MKVAFVSLMLVTVFIASAYAETPIMPGELLEIANNEGCSQVSDFYESKHHMVNPPYVYGYLPGPEEESAAFWCKALKKDGTYLLVLVYKKLEHELTKCPDKIEWRNPPRGLSIYRDKRTTLKDFVYIDDPKRKVSENVHLTNPGILSEYDGVEELFYCYTGKWLVRQRH